jgi:hypothetical protein
VGLGGCFGVRKETGSGCLTEAYRTTRIFYRLSAVIEGFVQLYTENLML